MEGPGPLVVEKDLKDVVAQRTEDGVEEVRQAMGRRSH